MKAYRQPGDTKSTTDTQSTSASASSDWSLSALWDWITGSDEQTTSAAPETSLLDAAEKAAPASEAPKAAEVAAPVVTPWDPTVGDAQAARYRAANGDQVDAMSPDAVRQQLLAEQAAKDSEPWVNPAGTRDLLDVARERQKAQDARSDGGHAWDLLEYAPKGAYDGQVEEGITTEYATENPSNGSLKKRKHAKSSYKYMYDDQGNETGWTNCSTFTTDMVLADAGYNIDKRMTVTTDDGTEVTAGLTDFANLRRREDRDYDLRTLQGDLETPIFDSVQDYKNARNEDSILTHGLPGALANAKDDDGLPLATYLPERAGRAEDAPTMVDLNFIRPGDALQTFNGYGGHSVIVSSVTGTFNGETITLTGEEDPALYPGFVATKLTYLSANASNAHGDVLTDKEKTVDQMYSDYTGLIAARPRYNDYGTVGFSEDADGNAIEVQIDPETMKPVGQSN